MSDACKTLPDLDANPGRNVTFFIIITDACKRNLQWQGNAKDRTARGIGFHPNATTVQTGNLSDNTEAQAGATLTARAILIHPKEAFEYFRA